MAAGSLCEPVEVRPGRWVRAERIWRSAGYPAPDPFSHFHDAVELVWFESVAGELVSEDGAFPLTGGTAVVVPSMRQHDFVIGPGPHEWILVQIDPALLPVPLAATLTCAVAPFAGVGRQRMAVLFNWLLELGETDEAPPSTLARVVELTLSEVVAAAAASPRLADARIAGLERLRPALDLVARDPASPPDLEGAAAACCLSPAYFSRRFKAVFKANWSDYVRSYRLRLAAQRLATGGARIGDISFSLGFATPAHFAALFQRRFGVSPRAYRAALRGQEQDDN